MIQNVIQKCAVGRGKGCRDGGKMWDYSMRVVSLDERGMYQGRKFEN